MQQHAATSRVRFVLRLWHGLASYIESIKSINSNIERQNSLVAFDKRNPCILYLWRLVFFGNGKTLIRE